MNKYRIKFFSGPDWAWCNYTLLAKNEDDVRTWVDKNCYTEEFRQYKGKDSLSIEVVEENVAFPYLLTSDDY